ncbi:hypothetical protein GWO63_003160 [Corynebacterium macginleyi]|uniref:Uncharacterized protein n=1 Tax=Corynebacterium macginleyi TaxID=38290 RepID=A0ABS1Y4K0_9CORY|nr:hypothetical protein [Corynebacterium macginleyi]MBK4145054.1 hypothetical protein [Corynebacterium macginleyi]MBK4166533.1 hypothetical protein [Corynebacterium macginleyi]MBM0243295.1 hypothetical protein [Corynebacterium macginleyi]
MLYGKDTGVVVDDDMADFLTRPAHREMFIHEADLVGLEFIEVFLLPLLLA